MIKFFLFTLCFISISLFGQIENLVDNGSFESTSSKIKGLGSIDATKNWYSLSAAKADLFLSDSKIPEIQTSGNTFGKEDPKKGNNYAGIVAYSYNNKEPRTYIGSKLNLPMKKGMQYCVSFYISLAEGSKYAINQVGVNFSSKAIQTEDKNPIIEASHILHPKKKVVNATYGWEKICGTYTAEGGESYIHIGNFTPDDKTSIEKALKLKNYKGKPTISAYYYIDDISVVMVDKNTTCNCYSNSEKQTEVFYHKVIVLEDHMTPIQRIEAHSTFFPFGQYQIQDANKETISAVIEEMKKNENFVLELFGHVDENELKLAEKRPQFADLANKRIRSIMEYMLENGIPYERMICSPVDEIEPNEEILPEDDDELKMAKNRRVMFKVKTKI